MRKHEKQQLLELINTLREAHKEAARYVENNENDTAIALLTECQNAAIEMGEKIEADQGEDAPTIACLQEYCEALYHVAVAVEEKGDYRACLKTLDLALQQTEQSIELEIKVRKEVVFLPYKASMWDSLESVWKAADADPDCDAYVVPIPYYDRNPDGSFKKIHYEGGQYPPEVPVVWYEDYNLAERRPDVIFIHNPYDDLNYVTSVAPAFYSSNLKNYTEKLVYIPYFVLGEIDPEDDKAVKDMAHFCLQPGVFNADKVIVQSEQMRQVYIRVLSESNEQIPRKVWEDKILGLGSPKMDKIGKTKRDELVIPKEWEAILRKPDGSRKKVILYNTSVTAILKHGAQMLVKMRDVFRVFREVKEDVALLWRPHPLIQATIESMQPKLWQEYKELVEAYKEEGLGIYDDTADLDRAITLCDAYYGDHSSLVQLCQKAGVPCMVQNVEMVEE